MMLQQNTIERLLKMPSAGPTPKNVKYLLDILSVYPDETLLSWAGYDSKRDWEDSTDLQYSRKELIEGNYDDILNNYIVLG